MSYGQDRATDRYEFTEQMQIRGSTFSVIDTENYSSKEVLLTGLPRETAEAVTVVLNRVDALYNLMEEVDKKLDDIECNGVKINGINKDRDY